MWVVGNYDFNENPVVNFDLKLDYDLRFVKKQAGVVLDQAQPKLGLGFDKAGKLVYMG